VELGSAVINQILTLRAADAAAVNATIVFGRQMTDHYRLYLPVLHLLGPLHSADFCWQRVTAAAYDVALEVNNNVQ